VIHGPVGRLLPNAFGLHDVHGNVFERCRDWYGGYATDVRAGDGLRLVSGGPSTLRVSRGGSFGNEPRDARSANRGLHAPTVRSGNLGARPSRLITE
jgi:sulfatase modifying factor 1